MVEKAFETKNGVRDLIKKVVGAMGREMVIDKLKLSNDEITCATAWGGCGCRRTLFNSHGILMSAI